MKKIAGYLLFIIGIMIPAALTAYARGFGLVDTLVTIAFALFVTMIIVVGVYLLTD